MHSLATARVGHVVFRVGVAPLSVAPRAAGAFQAIPIARVAIPVIAEVPAARLRQSSGNAAIQPPGARATVAGRNGEREEATKNQQRQHQETYK